MNAPPEETVMRRPHLTSRVLRGLDVLIDVPPLLRRGKNKADAARAIEWIAAMRQWKTKQTRK